MKNLKKLALVGVFATIIPMASFADDDHNYESSCFEDKIFAERFKEANYEFEGRVDKRPKESLSGTWIISGIKVIVDDTTYISHSEDKIKIGDDVGILAKRENGKITALDIEQDD